MNGIHMDGKVRGSEKAVPGCLGRMVNLFDLTSGVPGNRLLTDKPHTEGFLPRSRSDVSRMSTIVGDEMEDKVMVSELRRSSSHSKPHGTPVKVLIAQEMSKDLELRHNSTNLVAKLMGLDALPKQQPNIASQRAPKCYTRKCHSDIPIGYWQEDDDFYSKNGNSNIHSHQLQDEFKDKHEILHQSERTNCRRDKSPQKGRSIETVNEKRMTLIRQKFVEAKRLATDEKLRQTKEFQDALDVLSSNGDLFLKVLQEPNSLFVGEGPTISPSTETKRITVLRPSKMMADEKQVKKPFQVKQVNLWENHPDGFSPTMSTWKVNESLAQPTRIVVLKPSPAKSNGPKTGVSSAPSTPRGSKSGHFFVGSEDEDAREAREVAKEITQQMRENLAGHRRNETILSSVFSNGYTGDESSFEKTENEFADNNLSDSEVMSPPSRHSWDYVNRFESPYSISSFSRASCSPESSVCREAKKRLSERWAMMSSNGSIREHRQFQRSSSTLGEMLALSEIKKPEICEEESDSKAEDHRASTSFLRTSGGTRENGDESPRNLSRSKSVPVSSGVYEDRLNVEACGSVGCNVNVPREMRKVKTSKTSFTGKVTSLFFSKNKKSRKDKSGTLQSNDESQVPTVDNLGSLAHPVRTSNGHSEVILSPSESHSGTVLLNRQDFHEGALSVSQTCIPGIQGENQDQPSPVSVLEQSFEEDEAAILGIDPHDAGKQPPLGLSKSNLIDKSPPIGSISRTLSWDECYTETTTNYPLNSPFVAEDDEGEWLYLIQSLLTMAGLDDIGQVGSNLSRWHSPESPLDPLLRDKYINLTAKEPSHEAKRRHSRSIRKLVFDSVNSALLDITCFTTPSRQLIPNKLIETVPTSVADKTWAWMKEWLSSEVKYLSTDNGDGNSLVERWVMKEVIGTGWANEMNTDVNNIGKEIERKLLEELVEETVVGTLNDR